jgi:hypothetical protein
MSFFSIDFPQQGIGFKKGVPVMDNKEEKRLAKEESRQLKKEVRATAKAEKAKKVSEDNLKYGKEVFAKYFGTKSINIYANGYIRVSGGVGIFGGPAERLMSIDGSSDITKKTGVGRTVVAALTFGVNTVLTPSQRGNLYLTIVTDSQIHTLMSDEVSDEGIKTMNAIVATGKAVLASQQSGAKVEGAGTSVADELVKLKSLMDSGILSQAEFDSAKAKLLG